MATGVKVAAKVESGKGFEEATLQALAARWYKGETLKDLAAEVGTTWQTLAGTFIAKGWNKTKAEHDASRKAAAQKAKAQSQAAQKATAAAPKAAAPKAKAAAKNTKAAAKDSGK
jgi:hypothetical protein